MIFKIKDEPILAPKHKPGVCLIEFEDVHAPIGLEIHAETPEEIPVSIKATDY